jgi:hypothetical protein
MKGAFSLRMRQRRQLHGVVFQDGPPSENWLMISTDEQRVEFLYFNTLNDDTSRYSTENDVIEDEGARYGKERTRSFCKFYQMGLR